MNFWRFRFNDNDPPVAFDFGVSGAMKSIFQGRLSQVIFSRYEIPICLTPFVSAFLCYGSVGNAAPPMTIPIDLTDSSFSLKVLLFEGRLLPSRVGSTRGRT